LHALDTFIIREYGAGFLLSPSSLVSAMHRNSSGETLIPNEFPDREDYGELSKYFSGNRKSRELKRVATPDGQRMRISGKVKDMGSRKIETHNENFRRFTSSNFPEDKYSFTLTGAAHLIDMNNSYMVQNMLSGLGFSVLVTGLLTLLLHRSWRMVIVFLIPNLLPLLVMAGVMGVSGIELKAATAIVFSIAFGIATDDTIHFISRLKIETGKGKTLLYAFKRTFIETGKPIILTTFILIGGFISLMSSNFQSTWYFGCIICLTLAVALIADLFLLPVLLLIVYSGSTRRKKKIDSGKTEVS
jgi:uncharacterized protein